MGALRELVTFMALSIMATEVGSTWTCLSSEHFFFSFLALVSSVHQTHTLGKPPIASHAACETPQALVAQSQHAFWIPRLMYWPQLKTLKSIISDQILPVPFYLKAHLSICSPLALPQVTSALNEFPAPTSLHLNSSYPPTCQLNAPLHESHTGRKVAHCFQFQNLTARFLPCVKSPPAYTGLCCPRPYLDDLLFSSVCQK